MAAAMPNPAERPVPVALVGAGEFGATFAAQVRRVPALRLGVVCDRDRARARAALEAGGYPRDAVAGCDSRAAILAALERGAVALVDDLALLADLPLAVVVEATGDPEAAARVAERALDAGYHLALVTKEAEVVIGPLLARRAKAAGLVHTPVDGDQPSLLVGLVARARMLGFPVVAAGKATESDYVYDPAAETLACWSRTIAVPGYARLFARGGDLRQLLAERFRPEHETATVPDLCEMAIVANHTGLVPDRPELHAPVARTTELPSVFRPRAAGGILARSGVVDVFACLRRPDELSFAGGVFAVVETPDAATGRLLAGKGIPASPDGRHLLLHNPVHLLGAEAPSSVLAAAREHRSTGGADVRPHVDLVARARRDLAAGEVLAMGPRHAIAALEPLVEPARALADAAPAPYYLAAGRPLARPVRRGAVLTMADVAIDAASTLYRLRREQDAAFGS
jgi:predicted homoserine dehydrogenase-like protein